jgi:hypothetical protein
MKNEGGDSTTLTRFVGYRQGLWDIVEDEYTMYVDEHQLQKRKQRS